jgi:hypothetical protein
MLCSALQVFLLLFNLGIVLKYNGNFGLAIEMLMDKARKTYFKIKKTVGLDNSCGLLEKLFDSLVSPILSYERLKYDEEN